MSELERTKTVPLVKAISHDATKTTYEAIELSEPILIQVQQFYDEQAKSGSLSAMGLLISLVSNVPREAIKKMAFTDYKACEVYMMSFLAYSPAAGEWGNELADVTYYYGWGPADAWSLTYSRLQWWYQQAVRINKVKAGKNG